MLASLEQKMKTDGKRPGQGWLGLALEQPVLLKRYIRTLQFVVDRA